MPSVSLQQALVRVMLLIEMRELSSVQKQFQTQSSTGTSSPSSRITPPATRLTARVMVVKSESFIVGLISEFDETGVMKTPPGGVWSLYQTLYLCLF